MPKGEERKEIGEKGAVREGGEREGTRSLSILRPRGCSQKERERARTSLPDYPTISFCFLQKRSDPVRVSLMHGYQLGAGGRESNGVRVMSGQYDNAGEGSMSPHPRRCSRPRASVAVGVPRSCGLRPLQTAEELMPLLPWVLCGGITLCLQLCHEVVVDHVRPGVCIHVKGE